MNLLEKEAAHQRAKYLKYKKLNKAFSKKKTSKEETFIIDDTLDSESSSSNEAHNSRDEDNKTSIAYDSMLGNNDKIGNIYIDSREDN